MIQKLDQLKIQFVLRVAHKLKNRATVLGYIDVLIEDILNIAMGKGLNIYLAQKFV